MSVFSSTAKTNSSNYQPGVDGLRAVAVMLVLLFHVGFSQVSGGFVGVDVFFVISGYLITGIIYNAASENRFSYIGFMGARIARLYPALIFTLIVTFIFCFLLYSPSDFTRVAKSGLYALASASNIYFSNSAGYFDTSQETNPLLHTWSLAVEQQFYLIWPILIVASVKFAKKITGLVIAVIAIISLIASQWAITNMQVEAYYLMPFRVFELGFGGVAFFISKKVKLSEKYKELMMFAGLLMIVITAFTYSSMTPFPGINAMLPVAGAVLCILSHDSKYCGFVINNRASVGVGLISYSVYLIHWPIIIFFKYWSSKEPSISDKFLIIASSLFVGYLMYVFIENRFRKIKIFSFNKNSYLFYAFSFAILFSFSFSLLKNGIPSRITDKSAFGFVDDKTFHNQNFGGGDTPQGEVILGDKSSSPSIIIVGDSLARQYSLSVSEKMKSMGRSAIGFFADGCFMSKEYTRLWKGKPGLECFNNYNNFIKYASSHDIPVFYAQRWIGYRDLIGDVSANKVKFETDDDYASFIVKNIDDISSKIKGKMYVALGTSGTDSIGGAVSCILRPSYVYQPCRDMLSKKIEGSEFNSINKLIEKKLLKNKNVKTININDYICHDGLCPAVDADGNVIYSDTVHFTKYASEKVWSEIMKNYNLY